MRTIRLLVELTVDDDATLDDARDVLEEAIGYRFDVSTALGRPDGTWRAAVLVPEEELPDEELTKP